MTIISKDNDVFTVIVRMSVGPQHMAELLKAHTKTIPVMQKLPGFLSLSSHKTHDDTQLIVYFQWQSQKDHENCMSNPVWQEPGNNDVMRMKEEGIINMDISTCDVFVAVGDSSSQDAEVINDHA